MTTFSTVVLLLLSINVSKQEAEALADNHNKNLSANFSMDDDFPIHVEENRKKNMTSRKDYLPEENITRDRSSDDWTEKNMNPNKSDPNAVLMISDERDASKNNLNSPLDLQKYSLQESLMNANVSSLESKEEGNNGSISNGRKKLFHVPGSLAGDSILHGYKMLKITNDSGSFIVMVPENNKREISNVKPTEIAETESFTSPSASADSAFTIKTL